MSLPDESRLSWLKASTSGQYGCVEVATHAGSVAVRDSKNPAKGAQWYTPHEWECFVGAVKAGEFDRILASVK
jgi:hypothetical protein